MYIVRQEARALFPFRNWCVCSGLRKGLLLAIATLFFFSPQSTIAAPVETSGQAAKIRAEYVRFRNIDPTSDNPQSGATWLDLARQVDAFVQTQRASPTVDLIRLNGADIYMRLWRKERNQAFAVQARDLLTPLVTEDGHDPEVQSWAFVVRGDVALALREPIESMKVWYRRAAGFAGDSGRAAEVAKQRLTGFSNRTWARFVPGPELETPRLAQSTERRRRDGGAIIVLDPGHGGDDSGAVGVGGLLEKDVTLDISKRVKEILEREYGARVFLTRETDTFVPLARRTAYANAKHAQAFISLHNNASPSKDANGLEAYYLDNTDDQASRKLAERENSVATGSPIDDLSFILSDLIQSGKLEDSIRLTRDVDNGLRRQLTARYSGTRFLGVKKAPFFVLVGAHMPCSLVEMFFIDNALDGPRLHTDAFRQEIARAVANGIGVFIRDSSDGQRARFRGPSPVRNRSGHVAHSTRKRVR